MTLSIVIPVYNVEKYLDECVQSALQLNVDAEIVLVDDGSTDSSGSLCDVWAQRDPRVRVIHQQNAGLSAARNAGIRSSLGKYIMFLDSDDYLDVTEAERIIACLDSSGDVVMGLYCEVYPDGEKKKENSPAFERVQGLVSMEDFLSVLSVDGNSCYMVAVRFLCRREFLLENDLFFLSGIYHEDEEWSQRLFLYADNIYVTNCCFYQYRQAREGSITAVVKPKRIFDKFTIISRGMGILRESSLSLGRQAYLRKQLAMLYYGNLVDYAILSKEEKKRAAGEYRQYAHLMKNIQDRKGKIVRIVLGLFGFRVTGWLLGIAKKIRKR